MEVTVTKNHVKIVGHYNLLTILNRIKNEEKAGDILKLRELLSKGEHVKYNMQKGKLPAFIITGKYYGSIRQECLSQYSQMVCLDFDNIPRDEIGAIKAIFCDSPYTLSCFISPSGSGLKIICRVNTSKEYHSKAYKQLGEYYSGLAGYRYDSQCNNIGRLCYFSHDAKLYYNAESKTYQVNLTWHMSQLYLFANENVENKIETSDRKPLKPTYHMRNGTMETYTRV